MRSPTPSTDWETDPVQLSKHHGLANDFLVVLDEVNGRGLTIDADLARRLCDRRTGVGADGLIHGALPSPQAEAEAGADVVMVLYNADGGRAEMSGNGIRCLAQAVALARQERELHLCIATDAGLRAVSVAAVDADGQAARAEAHMGRVGPGPEVPPEVAERLARPGPAHARRLVTAEVGNPHLVVEVDDPQAVDVADLGPWIESRLPGGINVELAAASATDPFALDMRVWERGAGLTEACGTGACATAAAFLGWAQADGTLRPEAAGAPDGQDPVFEVTMPGGSATVRLRPDGEAVLSGLVHHVATIELPDA